MNGVQLGPQQRNSEPRAACFTSRNLINLHSTFLGKRLTLDPR